MDEKKEKEKRQKEREKNITSALSSSFRGSGWNKMPVYKIPSFHQTK